MSSVTPEAHQNWETGENAVVDRTGEAGRLRVAFVHEWLNSLAGSEKVLEAMAELFPEAPVHALTCDSEALGDSPLGSHLIHTSFIDRLPWGRRRYRMYLPLMPLAVEQFDLRGYEVVVSSSHAVAKGVLTQAEQVHVAYVHTPMRYAWDLYFDYLAESGLDRRRRGWAARVMLHYLRLWDAMAASRVDHYLANSHYVARRVWKTYRREAQVLYPPVDVERFKPARKRDDFYLIVCRMVPYKRVDLVVRAFAASGRPLVVIGDGPEREKVAQAAGGKGNISLLGEQSDEVVADHMQRCRAFVFAAEEDFGITVVEAQAAGAPVIAYGRGGALETVDAERTGVFFEQQNEASLNEAVTTFERGAEDFDAEQICSHAQRFSRPRFQAAFERMIEQVYQGEREEVGASDF